jgi:ribosome-binding protein aMBF1 (putative translation factor)
MKWTDSKKWHEEQMRDPLYRKKYEALEVEFDLIRQVLNRRIKLDMSQAELAHKMKSDQATLSRLESGNFNPSIKFLKRLATALDSKLKVSFV